MEETPVNRSARGLAESPEARYDGRQPRCPDALDASAHRRYEHSGRRPGAKALVELLEKVLGRALLHGKRGPETKAKGQET